MNLPRFGVRMPVPVNILMATLLIGGLFFGLTLRREFFPEVEAESATVSLPYPGATPTEVEEALARKVEDKLVDLDEVDTLRSTLAEGGGGITVELREGTDPDNAIDEIQRAIDSLLDLPEESETIQVSLIEPRLPVIRVVIYGDVDEQVLKQAIRGIRDDLQSLPDMGEMLIDGVRDYEVRVDIDREALVKLGISLPQIADVIRDWMVDLPGGTVRSTTGNVKVRTLGVAERARLIRQIPIKADSAGRIVLLGDIANVNEDFVDEQVLNRFNGQPSAALTVFAVGDQDIVKMAKAVRAYVAGRNGKPFGPEGIFERLAGVRPGDEPLRGVRRYDAWALGSHSTRPLPPGAAVSTNSDLARFVEGRLDLLLRNAKYGAVLVFITLLMFLNWRAAMWVGVGLATALAGTIVMMWAFDITLNLLTMFGLIVVLGLLVDDAIVVAENIQTRHDGGEPALEAAVNGATQVSWPVVATVLTSVVAFLPLSFIRGNIGDMLGALPIVVACALSMSLVESLLILPSHMGHSLAKRDRAQPRRFGRLVNRLEDWRDHLVMRRLVPWYGRTLEKLLAARYATIAVALSLLIVSMGMLVSGRLVFEFLPKSDAETIVVDVRMPIGTPVEVTDATVRRIEQAAFAQDEMLSVSTIVGRRANIETGAPESSSTHVAQMYMELKFVEQRDRESSEVIDSIRQALRGKIDQVERINFTEITGGPAGADISVEVRGDDAGQMDAAVLDLKQMLAHFEGVHDVSDDNDLGQLELQIEVTPSGAALGFTNANVAQQVRGALFGIDAHVFAEQQEDIDVRVRLDERTRRSLNAIENLWLISPAGKPVPLTEIATISESENYATIKRIDRRRAITVTAETDPRTSPETIVAALTSGDDDGPAPIAALRAKYPRLDIRFAGRQEQLGDAFASLPYGFLAAMVMIYVILAWLFSSYAQPILVMLAVPFATAGVIWGHLLLGYELTFLSLIGFVALSGIVVNDSLIYVQFFNAERQLGKPMTESLVNAGRVRLRPILLTTITTVLGLTPLILEQSFQAKFLIPMAISIACGLMSATMLILIVLPCFMLVLDDAKGLLHRLWHGLPRQGEAPPEPTPAA